MGLFSRAKPINLDSLKSDEIDFLISFFENKDGRVNTAWEKLGRSGRAVSMLNNSILSGIRSGYLTKQELDITLELLDEDSRLHPTDELEYRVKRALWEFVD